MQSLNFKNIFKELIATSSISSTEPSWDQGNRELIAKMNDWFSALGFETELTEVEPNKWNLLAVKGKGEGGLLLSGHSDTVPFDQGRWQFDPLILTEHEGKFYGLGTADMKGFFAFIIETVKRIDWSKQQKPLYVLATCDEETTMLGARHFAKNAPVTPDCCLIGEPTSLVPVWAHKGHIANAIRVVGKSGHSSDPALGLNAIDIMYEILAVMRELRAELIKKYQHPGFDIPNPTMNFGHIHGGDSANRICGCCELHYDLRPLPGMSIDGLEQLLLKALQPLQQKWPSAISVHPLHAPISGYECQQQAFISDIEQVTIQKAQSVNYCTEAPFLQTLCPTLVLGPGSIEQAHQPNEYLEMAHIEPTIDILSKIIRKYCF